MRPYFIIGTLSAVVIYDEIKLFQNRRDAHKMVAWLDTAAEIMQADQKTIEYFISLINKHKPELDEFDYIALQTLGISFN
jgi:hypothetical protein